MRNQYLFFAQQLFENFDLANYKKTDTTIPNTTVHIYSFECIESDNCSNDKSKAQMLDELTKRLNANYPDMFQLIDSESSQFFCKEIYPYVVAFETKLRAVLYIARALFENKSGNHSLNKQSFLYKVDKKDQSIEELDFGKIYEYIFTDQDVQSKIRDLNNKKMTKDDWKKKIEELEENTIWHNMVGIKYDFIEKHFLEIIEYRNDVMHNHLISYAQYEKAIDTLKKANQELDRAVKDILLVNKSPYLNDVNIFEAIGIFIKALGLASKAMKESQLAKALQWYVQYLESGAENPSGGEDDSLEKGENAEPNPNDE